MENIDAGENWGISYGIPDGVAVALKNGWLPVAAGWQVNSIGQVTGSGRRYLIAVMTNEDPSEGFGIATIERISGAAWQALAGQTLLKLAPPAKGRGFPAPPTE